MSRGKEYKGQTLVVDGSKSGASVVITRLAYDSAFNLEFIGEARYGSSESDLYWYIEKLSYDSAFNLISIETAQNKRILASQMATISQNTITVDTSGFVGDLFPGTPITETFEDTDGNVTNANSYSVVSSTTVTDNQGVVTGYTITLDGNTSPTQTEASLYIVSLEDYTVKDFNKRAWDARVLYEYA